MLPPRIQAWKTTGQAGEILSKIQMDDQENFSQETIDKFQSDAEFYREFVKKIEVEVNNHFPVVSFPFTLPLKSTNKTPARSSHRAPPRPLREQRSPST